MIEQRPENQGHQQPMTPLERLLALPALQNVKTYSNYYMARCPVHQGESLYLKEDDADGHVIVFCYGGGCARADICAAWGIQESELYVGGRPKTKFVSQTETLDLFDLALNKRIPPSALVNFHVEDGYTWHTQAGKTLKNVVRIQYLDEDGSLNPRSRIRTAVSAGSGSYWDGLSTDAVIPYGLWKLQEARTAKKIFLVEGESDSWTLWLYGYPALGIPGARMTNCLQAQHLREIETVYIVREPPSPKGDAGRSFVEGLRDRLAELGYKGEVFVISLQASHGLKDPNELHVKLFDEKRMKEFKGEFGKAIHAAAPLSLKAPNAKEKLEDLQPLIEQAIADGDTTALYDLAERIARLGDRDEAVVTTLIKQAVAQKKLPGWSQRHFNTILRQAAAQYGKSQQHIRVSKKPDILLTGDKEQDAEAALQSLYGANVPPVIFVRGGHLVRAKIDEEGRPALEQLDESILLYEMARAANYLRYNSQTQATQPVYPPTALASDILSHPNWQFPALSGITEVPIVRPDGSILNTPGYDKETHLLYLPAPDLDIPAIPDQPTGDEVHEARNLAWSYIAQFPYETRADAANAFGLMLTVVIRNLVELCPMHVVDAPLQGSGKGLLTETMSYIAQGRSASSTVIPGDENEWRKTLTALLLEGESYISLDNVEGLLASPTLASFLTSRTWKARLLGSMQAPRLKQQSIVLANGNNVALGGDIPRRCVRIRIDPKQSRPWTRTKFRFSPLLKYVLADRGKIIAALLTMVRAWFVAGQPAPATTIPGLGEFGVWANLVGGILAFAGVNRFLGNVDQLYEQVDTEGPQWTAFLDAWHAKQSAKSWSPLPRTTAQLVEHLKADEDFAALLPGKLAGPTLDEPKHMKAFAISLGRHLQRRKDTPYGPENIKIQITRDKHTKQNVYSVSKEPVAPEPTDFLWDGQEETEEEQETRAVEETAQAEEPTGGKTAESLSPVTPLFDTDDANEYIGPTVCDALDCVVEIEAATGDERLVFCQQHQNRATMFERARNLHFPELLYAQGSKIQEAGEDNWLATVISVNDAELGEIGQALARREDRERVKQTLLSLNEQPPDE
jgi:hypothetical protein